MTELKPCPFAKGGETRVVVCDYEGNIHGDLGCEYEQDPWGGLAYGIIHIHEDDNCLIQQEHELVGRFTFDTAEEAIKAWNTRTENTCQVIGYSVISDERVLMCQLSCGHRVPSLDLGPFNPSFSHCPRCNAKVVQDDN